MRPGCWPKFADRQLEEAHRFFPALRPAADPASPRINAVGLAAPAIFPGAASEWRRMAGPADVFGLGWHRSHHQPGWASRGLVGMPPPRARAAGWRGLESGAGRGTHFPIGGVAALEVREWGGRLRWAAQEPGRSPRCCRSGFVGRPWGCGQGTAWAARALPQAGVELPNERESGFGKGRGSHGQERTGSQDAARAQSGPIDRAIRPSPPFQLVLDQDPLAVGHHRWARKPRPGILVNPGGARLLRPPGDPGDGATAHRSDGS